MKRKPRWTLEMLTASLAVLCGLLLLVLLVQRPTAWLLLAVLVVLWGIGATLFRCKLRRWVVRWTSGTTFEKSKVQFSLEPFPSLRRCFPARRCCGITASSAPACWAGRMCWPAGCRSCCPAGSAAVPQARGTAADLADGYWSVHSSTVPGEAESVTLLVLNEETELRRIEQSIRPAVRGILPSSWTATMMCSGI